MRRVMKGDMSKSTFGPLRRGTDFAVARMSRKRVTYMGYVTGCLVSQGQGNPISQQLKERPQCGIVCATHCVAQLKPVLRSGGGTMSADMRRVVMSNKR